MCCTFRVLPKEIKPDRSIMQLLNFQMKPVAFAAIWPTTCWHFCSSLSDFELWGFPHTTAAGNCSLYYLIWMGQKQKTLGSNNTDENGRWLTTSLCGVTGVFSDSVEPYSATHTNQQAENMIKHAHLMTHQSCTNAEGLIVHRQKSDEWLLSSSD